MTLENKQSVRICNNKNVSLLEVDPLFPNVLLSWRSYCVLCSFHSTISDQENHTLPQRGETEFSPQLPAASGQGRVF